MIRRRVAAVVLVLTLYPALLYAQDTVLTITVQSADVREGPSTGAPVVGRVSRGTVLPVERNLGSWARVAWPDARDGVGYVHVSAGRFGGPKAAPLAPATPPRVAPPANAASAPASGSASAPQVHKPVERVAVRGPQGAGPISHIVGLGGLVGPMSRFGATARAWRTNHLGIQFEVSRDAMTSDTAPGRVTSIQLEPALVYELFDHVSDYVWFRPYVGSGLSFRHQTLKIATPDVIAPVSDSAFGYRVFGGSELTFAGATRFALSAELGYRRYPTPFAGFEPDRFSIALAGHWYIK